MFQPKHVVRTTTEHVFEVPRGSTARDLSDTIHYMGQVAAADGRPTDYDDWYTVRDGVNGIELVLRGQSTEEPYGAPQPKPRGAADDVAGF